jgi:Dyp-type peroxidase family
MTVDLSDVQGNVVRGYGLSFDCARHVAVGIGEGAAGSARAFIRELVDGERRDGLEVTPGDLWNEAPPSSCLNVAITWPGLAALGVPQRVLDAFPRAFQEGAATRAVESVRGSRSGVGLGDVGPSHPDRWVMGGPSTPTVHLLISVHARDQDRLDDVTRALRAALGEHGLAEHWCQDAARLRDDDRAEAREHFGYIDGIAQPRIVGVPGAYPSARSYDRADRQPDMPTGDLLLGCGYENSFLGNYAGDLPGALVDNATYGAFRMLYQDVAAFEDFLDSWADQWSDRERVAAKMMGRWRRTGVPLVMSPDAPDPGIPTERLNDFDYPRDDPDGLRCPIGAHIRRLNPRGGLVMGKSHSRRLVRRGMPYGPAFQPGEPPGTVDRGLIGYFLCGDLEVQWEFIQRAWVHDDIATSGIRGTREPIGGTQLDGGGAFSVPTNDTSAPITLERLPTFVHTRAGAYCLLPGIGGLRHLASLPESGETRA